MELKNWLKSCKYPENVINRAFRNARLQGPVPFKTNSNNIPFVTTYYDNVNYNEKVKKIRNKSNDILTPIILYNQRGYLSVQINAAKFVRCM